jgi:hypothetical protein
MSLEDAARAWLAWLSALTLGQIWAALCNPPDKLWKTALFVAAAAWSVPEYWGRFRKWHRGRKRVKYVWPAPKVSPDPAAQLLAVCRLRRPAAAPRPLPPRGDPPIPRRLASPKPRPLANPQEASPTWHGEVIPNPDLFAHKRNPALLPSNASGEYITCYDPSSGEHIETRRLPTAEDIARQVARADAAQPKWARTTFAQRASVLRSIKAWILRDMDSIVAVACRDTGKTRVDAVFGEILTTLAKIDWLVKNGEKVLKPERRALSLLLAHKISEVSSHERELTPGPLRAPRHRPRVRVVELFVPQRALAHSGRAHGRRRHRRQVLRAGRLELGLVYRRRQGVPPRVRAQRRHCPARRLPPRRRRDAHHQPDYPARHLYRL